jgi:ethanolamine permease
MQDKDSSNNLKPQLGALTLWGLGVGYVISGMYFGWNLGLPVGGTLGLGLATFVISLMYLTFTFSYAELACAIPKAGGAFDYAKAAFGREIGFLAGIAQAIEFIFAPPAIAAAIGAYFNLFLPDVSPLIIALIAYLIFTGLNIYGVKAAARFELIITILAVFELLLFAGFTLPHLEVRHLQKNALPQGWLGAFAAIPFAIWFFLGIEGVANVAEETINPQRNILLGFGSAIITLVILAFLTFFSAIGVNGWESIVYIADNQQVSDSPLPLALGKIVGNGHLLYHLLVSIGLFGLVASFHGIILAAGRAVFEMGREHYVHPWVGKVNPRFGTPANALIVNMLLGILALFTGRTAEIITLAVFGALTLYIISMLALFQLRKISPNMERPFRVPFYPLFPILALSIAIIALLSVIYFNPFLALIYLIIILLAYIWFRVFSEQRG